MGISGKYTESFEDATLALTTGVHLDADYNHTAFDVMDVGDDKVTLRSHYDKSQHILDRKCDDRGEYVEIELKSAFEDMLNQPAKIFRVVPMSGTKTTGGLQARA